MSNPPSPEQWLRAAEISRRAAISLGRRGSFPGETTADIQHSLLCYIMENQSLIKYLNVVSEETENKLFVSIVRYGYSLKTESQNQQFSQINLELALGGTDLNASTTFSEKDVIKLLPYSYSLQHSVPSNLRERVELINGCIHGLSEKQEEAIALFYGDGKKTKKEISAELGITSAALLGRLNSAMSKILRNLHGV